MAAFSNFMMDSERMAVFESGKHEGQGEDDQSELDQNFNHLENERTKGGHELVRINVCGAIYETYLHVLNKYPKTLLGSASKRAELWDPMREEYFVDAHAATFESIFVFYQTGRLRKPFEVPMETFFEQLEKFEINPDIIRRYKENEGVIFDSEEVYPEGEPRRTIWETFEYPNATRASRICAYVSVTFIFLSLFVFCVETLPQFKGQECKWIKRIEEGIVVRYEVPNLGNSFFLLEAACVLWFTLEYVLRLYSCPHKCVFIIDKMNLIDLITVIPFFATLAITLATNNCRVGERSQVVLVMRVLRVFRVFKLTKHSRKLRVWVYAVKASTHEFILFTFFLLVSALLFASILYFAEMGDPNSQISTIPDGIWWGLATMTTVGYGDVVPITSWGKGTAAACVVFGVLVVALPTPIIVANFNKYYRAESGRGFNDSSAMQSKRKKKR